MTNKVVREKSHCIVCRSNKSRFLINNYLCKYKVNTYCLKCKKETSNIDPKMVKTKNNRLLMQSKCSVCKT